MDLLLSQRREYHDIVHTVEEFRTEVTFFSSPVYLLLYRLRIDRSRPDGYFRSDTLLPMIGSHDDDRILEVYRPSLIVGQAAVVQELQQNIEDIRMRFRISSKRMTL